MEKPVYGQWEEFRRHTVSDKLSENEVDHLRIAFFAGATSMFYMLLRGVSPTEEITQNDLNMMGRLETELKSFMLEMITRERQAKARGDKKRH